MNAIQTAPGAAPPDGSDGPVRAPLAEPLEPRRLPEIRAEIVQWLHDGAGVVGNWASITFPANEDTIRADALRNARFLRDGGLYLVSAEMTEEILEAAAAMPSYSLRRDDPPAPSGLVVWQHPVTSASPMTRLVGAPMIAASWGPHPQGFEVRLWAHRQDWIADAVLAQELYEGRRMSAAEVEKMRKILYRANPMGLVPATVTVLPPAELDEWPTSALRRRDLLAAGEEVDETIRAVHVAVEGERALVATWKLMRQEIAAHELVTAERSARKRIARISPQLPADVRVVSLRRPRPEAGTATGRRGRVYTEREDVAPHWKNVYFPSTGTHERKWISKYERGPKGAPKRTPAERVDVLRR